MAFLEIPPNKVESKVCMEVSVFDILKNKKLSVTDSRKKIIELFQENNGAMAHSDIEKKTGDKFDRVTIYRTLQTFVDKGIVHVIPTVDNSVLYALCKDDCFTGHHHDNHVHFICDSCNITYCLDSIVTPNVNLPQGFKPNLIDVVVTGVCKNC